MKKIFTLLFGAALFGICSTASAQQNIFEWKNGYVSARSIEDVDSVSFSAPGLFKVECSEAANVTASSFTGTATVAFGDGIESVSGSWPTTGICYSYENSQPTTDDDTLWVGDEPDTYEFAIDDLIQGTKYYYRAYVEYAGDIYYSDTYTVMTSGEKGTDKSRTINGHLFVDLGLPSGLLWADTNVGATTATDYGNYYAWGETTTKDEYNWVTYKYGDPTIEITKYNSSDKLTTLEASDDAATVSWGAPCRMPSNDEFKELFTNCASKWTSKTASDGTKVAGFLITSKKNGKSIFLPAAGSRYESYLYDNGLNGYYWSSSASAYTGYSYYINFFNSDYNRSDFTRNYGYSVRPVAAQ